jgi:hypothetical protein
MSKQFTYLALLLAFYSQNGFCDWIKVGSDENQISYVNNAVNGKYWIRNYSVMLNYLKPKEIEVLGTKQSFSSVVELKTLDCLFGNTAYRDIGFYTGAKGTGKRYVRTGKGFEINKNSIKTYDYRWFQFDREYDDEIFKHVCGDLYNLRSQHLFWKIPRQSPM